MRFLVLSLLTLGLLSAPSFHVARAQDPPQTEPTPLQPTPRIRPQCPVRLGGVFTLGLGENSAEWEDSAALGVKLSADNQHWIAANCDVVALNPVNLTPDTFPAISKEQRLFTPLLLLSAAMLSEQPGYRGSVGGWKPEMEPWTLRGSDGKEVPYPVKGGHWMDFANTDWAAHWRDRAQALVRQYGAQGVVAADLPLANLYVGEDLAQYKTEADRIAATTSWLHAVRAPERYLMIPSARSFGHIVGHATLATPPGTEETDLSGRLWDDYYSLMDGAWAESWVHWYNLSEDDWEIALEAADRAGRSGQVFIATAIYHNDAELEFDLASYLLVVHTQGRCVFQPMPILPDAGTDAGRSLAVLRKQVAAKAAYFNVPLGFPLQERHTIATEGGTVWRRAFTNGVVYVNSSEKRTCTLQLGGALERVTGEKVRQVVLPPQSGVILRYPTAG